MGEAVSNCLSQVGLILGTLDHRDVVCCWSCCFPVRLSSTQASLVAIANDGELYCVGMLKHLGEKSTLCQSSAHAPVTF